MKMTSVAACGVLAALLGSTILAGAANAAVVVSSAQTANMSCSGGVCAPTAKDAVLNVGDLETLLASGNVEIATTGAGVQAVDIRVVHSLAWSSQSTLALDAYKSVAIGKAVSVTGSGGFSLTTNDGGTGGALGFGKAGQVTFASLSSPLAIDGASYTLVDNIKSLAGAVAKNPSGDYALATNNNAAKDGTYAAAPVATTFSGSFEGLGNTISGLSVVDDTKFDYVGLFAQIGASGTVADLRLAGVAITGEAKMQSVGGLVGVSLGMLSDDSVSGAVTGGKLASVGGLAGTGDGTIRNSHSSVGVQGQKMASAGGLVGAQTQGAVIINSYATGDVKVLGGFSRGRPEGSWGGGLVGLASGMITGSFATGNVMGAQYSAVGGLVGDGLYGVLKDCYATGAVVGGPYALVGGLIGGDQYGTETGGRVADSYSEGAVSGGASSEVGGFAGVVDYSGSTKNDYWDTTTSGTDTGVGEGSDAGITGLTTTQLQSGLPKGFSPKIWGEDASINNGLPYLLANPPPK